MPLVNGTLTDFGLDPLALASPVLIFRASSTGLTGLNVLSARKAVEVTPAPNGFFEVDLVATSTIAPANTHYTVEIRYRDPSTGIVVSELLPWKLFVPADGGALGDLLRVPSNPALVWVGAEPPAPATPGTWWLDPATGDLAEFDGEGWAHKANLRGPAGLDATNAAEDDAALAQFIATQGTDTRAALTAAVEDTAPAHRATVALRRIAPRLVSHRTSDAGLPENTTEAMLEIPEYVEIVEIDVRRTADGQTVLMHDPTLDRTTNGTGNVADKTLAQLKALAVDNGGTIPTLLEALDTASDCDFAEVLVDIPGDVVGDAVHLAAVASIVEGHEIADRCVIMTRSTAQAAGFRAVNSTLRMGGFGVTLANVAERITGALANNVELLLIEPGDYAANRPAIMQIQAAGLRAGSSTNNDPVTLEAAKQDGAEIVLTDIAGSLRRYAGGPRELVPPVAPTDIAGLVSWHDASTLTALDGAALPAWNDTSGNGHTLAQADAAKQPVYRASGINGKPAVEFDGIDDIMLTAAFSAALEQPNTVIVVAQIVALSTVTMDRVIFDGLATGRHTLVHSVSGTGGTNQSWKIVAGGTAQGSTNRAPLSPHLHIAEYNAASSRLITDGEVISATGTSPGSNNMTGLVLGNRASDGARPSNVRVAWVGVYDRILTPSELAGLSKGLRRTYGI